MFLFVAFLVLSKVMKTNAWHSIEQCTVDASIDQWHSRFRTCTCAEGGYFKQIL